MWKLMWWSDNVSPRGDVCTRHIVMYVFVCVRVNSPYTHVHDSVISGLSIFLGIYAKPLNTLSLYTHQYAFIFVMGDFFFFFYADDVARPKAFDSCIKSKLSILIEIKG